MPATIKIAVSAVSAAQALWRVILGFYEDAILGPRLTAVSPDSRLRMSRGKNAAKKSRAKSAGRSCARGWKVFENPGRVGAVQFLAAFGVSIAEIALLRSLRDGPAARIRNFGGGADAGGAFTEARDVR